MARVEKFREPLGGKWRNALVGDALVDRIQAARDELKSAVIDAQATLNISPLTDPAAQAAAKELNKSGNATIVLEDDGVFWLEVDLKMGADGKRPWSSDLPSLPALRIAADELGVDLGGMGRSKTRIIQAIERAKRNAAEQEASKVADGTPRRRMTKTAPSLAVLTQVTPGNGDPRTAKPRTANPIKDTRDEA